MFLFLLILLYSINVAIAIDYKHIKLEVEAKNLTLIPKNIKPKEIIINSIIENNLGHALLLKTCISDGKIFYLNKHKHIVPINDFVVIKISGYDLLHVRCFLNIDLPIEIHMYKDDYNEIYTITHNEHYNNTINIKSQAVVFILKYAFKY